MDNDSRPEDHGSVEYCSVDKAQPASSRETAVETPGFLERAFDAIARALATVPRWMLPINVAAVAMLAWITVAAMERSGTVRPLSSALALAFGLLLVISAALVAQAMEIIDHLRARIEVVQAEHSVDPLTGLMARAAISADIKQRLADRSQEYLVGVLFCDLDRLKVVNDSLGHEAGDQILQVAAQRIRRVIRADDSIGRFGGDKFVVVTSALRTPRDLEVLARRLVEALSEPTVLADESTQVVSASVGIAWSADDKETADPERPATLLRDADSAMQVAKVEGGAGFSLFDPSVRARTVARLELEQDLRRGIKDDELVVHYQPIVDVISGDAVRYEALVRWNHPVRGMIHPADFLSVAAESSLIVDIGDQVLRQACHQAVRWTEMTGRPITVAVNVAERQLLDLGLVGLVTRALAESGLAPGQLELEVTEELIMERHDRALLVFRQLEMAGVKLVIDDFGTSQASLARLQNLAMVSTLKIDRVFVEGLANESIDRNVVTAIVSLAEDIGMSIVAEGVEQPEQADVLRELGVRLQQGFLYQRPGPADTMVRHLHRLQHGPETDVDDETFDAAVADVLLETSPSDSSGGETSTPTA